MSNNGNPNEIGTVILNCLKAFFTRNLGIKILSLVFAVLIWGYVILYTNPETTKLIENIPVSFSGESDLNERGLAIRGDQAEILKPVSALVNVELTKFTDLDTSDIYANVSLRNVTAAGTHRLRINATTTEGTVASVSPGDVVVEVDELVTRVVPIEVEYSGVLPEGYWKGEPSLNSSTVSISGPKEDVATVKRAICTVALDGRTGTFTESVLLKFVDSENRIVSSTTFLNKLPSVVVRLEVLRIATLNVDVDSAIMGMEALPANYEIYDIVATPPAVRVVGTDEVISGLSSIMMEHIDISGNTSSIQAETKVIAPEGVTLLDEPTITVYVDIRERVESETFPSLPIEARGLNKKYEAELSVTNTDLSVTGRVSLIRILERSVMKLYVDLTGLEPGVHTVQVRAAFPSEEMQTELEWTIAEPEITVVISE